MLAALQALTLGQQTDASNSTNSTLLATHDYLAGDRKRTKLDESDATVDEDTVMAGPSNPTISNILPLKI